jgi:LysM repeat protein
MGKPLKILVYKVSAVFCVVSVVFLITTAIAGSFNNSISINDDEAVNMQGSFIYATEYLNPYEEIVEESYFNGDFFNESSVIIQNSAFVANNSPAVVSPFLASERSGIVTYEVQPGDIPSEIASMFGITTNTLLWANNLTPNSRIKVGQKLTILPVSGVKHTIKKGETLDAIVKKYKGNTEKTIALNGLPANGNLNIGKDIIIPDGQKPVEYIPVKARTYASYTPEELGPYGDTSHGFPWGQCTWYIAQKRYIPWNGDAKNWLAKAKQYGFEIGTEPKAGSIVVTRESVYGHVAYVEAFDDSTITVSEMSLGRGIKRIRILDQDDWRIRGYIY